MIQMLKEDSEICTLIEKCAANNYRSLFVIYGENAHEKVMVIHHHVTANTPNIPSILWCHKNYSEDISKLKKTIKKSNKRREDILNKPFELFLASVNIKFCSYTETSNILGNTYGMCILQDFESITPNSLCKAVETVIGGGSVIILLPHINKFREFSSITMEKYSHLKTYSHPEVYNHYIKRFMVSLMWCKSCLVVNNELKISREHCKINDLGMSKHTEEFVAIPDKYEKILSDLLTICKTVDQRKAVETMIDVINNKDSKSTVSLTAGRGRGKSTALGLATAYAIYKGTGNIFVVAPSPENLRTFFEFLLKALDVLEYEEHTDYDIGQAEDKSLNNEIICINVFKKYRQFVQYIKPNDYEKLGQAELIIIDEAAAIPLTQVKAMFGPYNIFMSSTVNGYEGTGRNLTLKLISQLRKQSVPSLSSKADLDKSRPLHEITLEKSIRYAQNDPVEKWLYDLLCLNATSYSYPVSSLPPITACELYYVNKDVLLSGRKGSEIIFNQIISLLVSSHYKNTPDDVQILSDSTAHHLFALVCPIIKERKTKIPSILSVVQVCYEGGIPKSVSKPLLKGKLPNGDLVPWTLASQFIDPGLTNRKSVRIVRVATLPEYQSMGYGSKAISLLIDFYKSVYVPLEQQTENEVSDKALLSSLSEITPPSIDYIGVSYGITHQLFKFWKKLSFYPIYISQKQNETTGECTCVMVHPLSHEEGEVPSWFVDFPSIFYNKFRRLLRFEPFRKFSTKLCLLILDSIKTNESILPSTSMTLEKINKIVNIKEIKRLESYSKRLCDRNLIRDLMPVIANMYFTKDIDIEISDIQAALLTAIGLKLENEESIAKEYDLPMASVLGNFNRLIRRVCNVIDELKNPKNENNIL